MALLRCAQTPITVANFLEYVDSDFYDGLIFHRVIENFMIQGGGYTSDLSEKSAFHRRHNAQLRARGAHSPPRPANALAHPHAHSLSEPPSQCPDNNQKRTRRL